MLNLGLRGMVVGDIDQSIYGFANKSSKYLLELTNLDQFNTFRLTTNFRSHSSIVEYANRLLRETSRSIIRKKEFVFLELRVTKGQLPLLTIDTLMHCAKNMRLRI